MPAFEEVESQVETGWIEEQQAEICEKAFAAMRERYQVVVPKELPVIEPPPLAVVVPQ